MEAVKNRPELPTQPEELMGLLTHLDIAHVLYEHEAIFTVEEGAHLKKQIPGQHTRNLFLRNKKKQMFLVTLCDDTDVDLKKLSEKLEVQRFSFGSPDHLMEFLGVTPGSVTPFAIVNDTQQQIQPVWDKKMMAAELAGYHPLINDKTITLKPDDLHKFAKHTGHTPMVIDFADLA